MRRRDLLKTTVLLRADYLEKRHAAGQTAPSNKLNIALIGCGRGTAHYNSIRNEKSLRFVMSTNCA